MHKIHQYQSGQQDHLRPYDAHLQNPLRQAEKLQQAYQQNAYAA